MPYMGEGRPRGALYDWVRSLVRTGAVGAHGRGPASRVEPPAAVPSPDPDYICPECGEEAVTVGTSFGAAVGTFAECAHGHVWGLA